MIAITGGGTGGHLAIAKAICEVYNKNGIRPIYIGSKNGQDRQWFEKYPGFAKSYFLQSQGVVNKKGVAKVFSLTKILKHSFTCKSIFKEHNIDKVFSVGGYSAAPASIAAILNRYPLFIHEQNAVAGKLNKLLRPFSKEFFSSYESPYDPYPVSSRFFENQRIRQEVKTILFLGGSQGASFINELAKKMAPSLHENNIKIIHQCGKKEYKKMQMFYKTQQIDVDLFDFSDTLHVKMKEADFAISRAGASTLWELVASCLPTYFIPFPYAANDHQYYNAKTLIDKNVAFLNRQGMVKCDEILSLIKNIDIYSMSQSLMALASPSGAEKIVRIIEHGRKK